MDFAVISLMLAACVATATATLTAAQRFQADKFLDMLGKSYDSKLAYADLLSALHRRLNLDPTSQSNVSSSIVDGGSTNFNTLADTSANCQEAPPRKGASITYTSDTHAQGSRALYQCDAGYNGKSMFIQCEQGGQWSLTATWDGCIPVDCGPVPPGIPNADTSFTTTVFESLVVYTCQSGYQMNVTNANITCLETGNWETPPFICEKGTNAPNPHDGGFTTKYDDYSMPGFAGMASLPNNGLASTPSMLPSSSNNNNPMAAMFAQMFPNMVPPAQSTTAATTAMPTVKPQPGGFQLPSHLLNLLPNGLSSAAGIRPENLMTLASLGLGSANPGAAPRDISQLLGTMNPMSLFGGSMGLGMGGASPGGAGAAAGPGAVPPDPEKMAEQREEMMLRAMMASAMKSMMGPSTRANTTSSNQNPTMDFMTLMALQNGLGAGGVGAGGAAGGFDPLSMMLGGMGGGGGAGLFGSLFGQA